MIDSISQKIKNRFTRDILNKENDGFNNSKDG